jgi:hypothetical protein
MARPRQTKLFTAMTMDNKDDSLFTRVMQGIMKNITHMCHDRGKTRSKDGWQKVVVHIVSDGCRKINPRTLRFVPAIRAYQWDIVTHVVDGKVCLTTHVFSGFSSVLPVEQDQRPEERNCSGADNPLLGGGEPEEYHRSTSTTGTGSLTRSDPFFDPTRAFFLASVPCLVSVRSSSVEGTRMLAVLAMKFLPSKTNMGEIL